jgi:hypothetical protein
MRTERTTGSDIINSYINDRNLGVGGDRKKNIYEAIEGLTLEDIKAAQDKWVEDRTYVYGILGDIKDLDVNYLKSLGEVQILSLEDIFGY